MNRFIFWSLLIGVLVNYGCQKDLPKQQTAPDNKVGAVVVGFPNPLPPDPSLLKNQKIGLDECDLYVDHYRACILSKTPEMERPLFLLALDQAILHWQQAAASQYYSHAAIIQSCLAAKAVAQVSVRDFGCIL